MKLFKIYYTFIGLFLAVFAMSCSNDKGATTPEPLVYGNLEVMNTGNVSSSGTLAPEGYFWSEVFSPLAWGQTGNVNIQFIAEDFVVPSGEKWNIQNFYFYAYQTGFFGNTFPLNEFFYEIYDSDPSIIGAVKLFGDMTTNKYISAEETKWFRIRQGLANSDRKIYKLKIQVENINLNSGTYWIKWGSKNINDIAHFYPQFPEDNNRVNNAKKYTVSTSTWSLINNGGINVSMPIEIVGTKQKN